MKEIIKKFLLENTDVEYRYIGGGDEPQIIVFTESEDWEREDFIDSISEKLEAILTNKAFCNVCNNGAEISFV